MVELLRALRMITRCRKLLFVGFIVIACMFFLVKVMFPPEPPSPRLIAVRHTVERGKPVLVFQVKDHGKRRMQITGVRVVGQSREPVFLEPADFAAPGWPCGDPSRAWGEFAVFVPTNTSLWSLEVRLDFDHGNLIRRARDFPSPWHELRVTGMPRGKAAWIALSAFYSDSSDRHWIESQVITNDVPHV
jgi:hypothetical protein